MISFVQIDISFVTMRFVLCSLFPVDSFRPYDKNTRIMKKAAAPQKKCKEMKISNRILSVSKFLYSFFVFHEHQTAFETQVDY